MYGDKARTKSAYTGIILVTGALIDGAFATQLGLFRDNRQAVGLYATIAAAFAHRVVDEYPFGGIIEDALLAAATFFRGAGLRVDQCGATLGITQFALNGLQLITMRDRNTVKPCQRRIAITVRLS